MEMKRRRDVKWLEIVSLVAWGVFFVFVIASGRLPLYINPRFIWLPGIGAVVLLAMGVSLWRGKSHDHGTVFDWRQATWFIMPIVLGLSIAPSALGAFVSGHRHGGGWGSGAGDSGISLDLAGMAEYKDVTVAELMNAGHIKSGKVSVVGQITLQPGLPKGQCPLVHYVMTCCVADLNPVEVTLQYPAAYQPVDGQWVRVSGVASRGTQGVVVNADAVENIPQPDPPYLYP